MFRSILEYFNHYRDGIEGNPFVIKQSGILFIFEILSTRLNVTKDFQYSLNCIFFLAQRNCLVEYFSSVKINMPLIYNYIFLSFRDNIFDKRLKFTKYSSIIVSTYHWKFCSKYMFFSYPDKIRNEEMKDTFIANDLHSTKRWFENECLTQRNNTLSKSPNV